MISNIYIRALEIGYERGNDGISLKEMNSMLENEKYSINKPLFRNWFYLNFENEHRRKNIVQPFTGFPEELADEKLPLCADSFMQYVEYLELNEARASSTKANKNARIAIYIAAVAMSLNVIFSIIEICRH